MYYIIKVKDLVNRSDFRTSKADYIMLESMFSDYSVVIPIKELEKILTIKHKTLVNMFYFGELFLIYDINKNWLSVTNTPVIIEHGIKSFMGVKVYFDFSKRFSKFLYRIIHDSNKTIGSMDACVSFLHDLSGGAAPPELWLKYCTYRVFNGVLDLSHSDVVYDSPF